MGRSTEEEALEAAEELLERLEASQGRENALGREVAELRQSCEQLGREVHALAQSLALAAAQLDLASAAADAAERRAERAERMARQETQARAGLDARLEQAGKELAQARQQRRAALREVEAMQAVLDARLEASDAAALRAQAERERLEAIEWVRLEERRAAAEREAAASQLQRARRKQCEQAGRDEDGQEDESEEEEEGEEEDEDLGRRPQRRTERRRALRPRRQPEPIPEGEEPAEGGDEESPQAPPPSNPSSPDPALDEQLVRPTLAERRRSVTKSGAAAPASRRRPGSEIQGQNQGEDKGQGEGEGEGEGDGRGHPKSLVEAVETVKRIRAQQQHQQQQQRQQQQVQQLEQQQQGHEVTASPQPVASKPKSLQEAMEAVQRIRARAPRPIKPKAAASTVYAHPSVAPAPSTPESEPVVPALASKPRGGAERCETVEEVCSSMWGCKSARRPEDDPARPGERRASPDATTSVLVPVHCSSLPPGAIAPPSPVAKTKLAPLTSTARWHSRLEWSGVRAPE
jgi:hypothetical protein